MPRGRINWSNPINPNSVLSRGLVGFWLAGAPHSWGGHKWYDLSPYRNHGTLTNMDPATDWTGSPVSLGALNFDGSDDEVSFTPTEGWASWLGGAPYGASFTFSVTPGFSGVRRVITADWNAAGAGAALSFAVEAIATDKYKFHVSTTSGITTVEGGTLASGVNAIVTGTWDTATMSIYVNGALVGGPTARTGTLQNGTDRRIGAPGAFTGGLEWLGTIECGLVHSRALSWGEVASLHREIKGRYPSLLNRVRVPVFAEQAVGGGGSILPFMLQNGLYAGRCA